MNAIQIELPDEVYARAIELAREKQMPLERLLVVALVEKLSTMFPDPALEERASRASQAGFDEFMEGVPDVEPEPYDRLTAKDRRKGRRS
jgi:hypothetical protein